MNLKILPGLGGFFGPGEPAGGFEIGQKEGGRNPETEQHVHQFFALVVADFEDGYGFGQELERIAGPFGQVVFYIRVRRVEVVVHGVDLTGLFFSRPGRRGQVDDYQLGFAGDDRDQAAKGFEIIAGDVLIRHLAETQVL